MKRATLEDLSTRQRKALAAVLACPTIPVAAAAAGVGERTLARYLSDTDFRSVLSDAMDERLAGAVAFLTARLGEALDVLMSVARDEQKSPAARVSAARVVVDSALRYLEYASLNERVKVLEEAMADVP